MEETVQAKVTSFQVKKDQTKKDNDSNNLILSLAIRFVLGDAYQNLSKEERQALLHVGV